MLVLRSVGPGIRPLSRLSCVKPVKLKQVAIALSFGHSKNRRRPVSPYDDTHPFATTDVQLHAVILLNQSCGATSDRQLGRAPVLRRLGEKHGTVSKGAFALAMLLKVRGQGGKSGSPPVTTKK